MKALLVLIWVSSALAQERESFTLTPQANDNFSETEQASDAATMSSPSTAWNAKGDAVVGDPASGAFVVNPWEAPRSPAAATTQPSGQEISGVAAGPIQATAPVAGALAPDSSAPQANQNEPDNRAACQAMQKNQCAAANVLRQPVKGAMNQCYEWADQQEKSARKHLEAVGLAGGLSTETARAMAASTADSHAMNVTGLIGKSHDRDEKLKLALEAAQLCSRDAEQSTTAFEGLRDQARQCMDASRVTGANPADNKAAATAYSWFANEGHERYQNSRKLKEYCDGEIQNAQNGLHDNKRVADALGQRGKDEITPKPSPFGEDGRLAPGAAKPQAFQDPPAASQKKGVSPWLIGGVAALAAGGITYAVVHNNQKSHKKDSSSSSSAKVATTATASTGSAKKLASLSGAKNFSPSVTLDSAESTPDYASHLKDWKAKCPASSKGTSRAPASCKGFWTYEAKNASAKKLVSEFDSGAPVVRRMRR